MNYSLQFSLTPVYYNLPSSDSIDSELRYSADNLVCRYWIFHCLVSL